MSDAYIVSKIVQTVDDLKDHALGMQAAMDRLVSLVEASGTPIPDDVKDDIATMKSALTSLLGSDGLGGISSH